MAKLDVKFIAGNEARQVRSDSGQVHRLRGLRDGLPRGGDRTCACIERRMVPYSRQHGGMGRVATEEYGIEKVTRYPKATVV